ncbi:MAG TPA: class I SAM-dependent methyltransferase [Chloroflexota bacterium]|nr:class I SAM-dependent methyltransferase [Chloroflexota bacterium]
MSTPDVAAAYDSIAADYDREVAGDLWMRRRLWQSYLRVFRKGQHVLDLSCGTGADAVFLAGEHVRVTGIDLSPAMIDRFRANARSAGVEQSVFASVLDVANLTELPSATFDGAISAFAGLNTVADLSTVAGELSRILRPRSTFVVHLLNRFSLWEWLGLLAEGRWTEARRLGSQDDRTFVIGGRSIQHTLYGPSDAYERFFTTHFHLRRAYGLGILRPPHTVSRIPDRVVRGLEQLERLVGDWYPFVHWGRFFVLELERRE